MALRGICLALTALVIGGCGGTSRPAATTAQPTETKTSSAGTAGAGFSGDDQINYEDAKTVCGESAPSKLAHDLTIRVDVHSSKGLRRLAERYAADYGPNLRKAVVEGCLAGLPKP
jgi:hypothetical protein